MLNKEMHIYIYMYRYIHTEVKGVYIEFQGSETAS
jgi:hypothetical protein